LIGCDLGERTLKEHQLRKLQAQARTSNVALVFLTQTRGHLGSRKLLGTRRRLRTPRGSIASIYSLVLNFEKKQLVVERAQHRPTPHILARSVSYARFTHHLGPFEHSPAINAKASDDASDD
jgi:hypothetical protein